jgi:hypothetical protein
MFKSSASFEYHRKKYCRVEARQGMPMANLAARLPINITGVGKHQ